MSEIKCPWCGCNGWREGTTTRYDCGSSIGCAHQKQSKQCEIIADLKDEIARLQRECIAASDQILKLMNQSCANEQQGSCRGFK